MHPVIGSLGCESWCVNLVLVSDQAMTGLNQDFRHKEGVTDVLSFPYLAQAGKGEPVLAADRGDQPAHSGLPNPGHNRVRPTTTCWSERLSWLPVS